MGAAIVLDLLCLFKGGLRTSSGLFEAGRVHFFGTIVLDCPNCFIALVLIFSDESVPVFGFTFVHFFILVCFINIHKFANILLCKLSIYWAPMSSWHFP